LASEGSFQQRAAAGLFDVIAMRGDGKDVERLRVHFFR
jgi:hypothetical protein